MSEVGETPPVPQQEKDPPVQRLEDMEEYQKLSPEQQEKLLVLRERLQNEAMDPRAVVTRSIDEMGFFEGLKETVKPHLAKQKEILFKELKANASLALSLIPVLGEGKGLGSGLLGITAKEGKALTKASKLADIQFEPLVRLGKAGEYAKKSMQANKPVYTLTHVPAAMVKEVTPIKVSKVQELWWKTKNKARDIFSVATTPLVAKYALQESIVGQYRLGAKEGAKVLAGKIASKMGVKDIYNLQQAKERLRQAAQTRALADGLKNAGLHHDIKWYQFVDQWKAWGVRRISVKAGKEAAKRADVVISSRLAFDAAGKNVLQKGIEGQIKRSTAKGAGVIAEGTKFGKFHAFFDKWLNLTPDVPVWLSTTTGVMEFLGAHGIDAIPAVLQMAHNRYKQVMVSKDMALDVLKYTAMRGLRKMTDRKAAAEVFPTTSSEAGLRGAGAPVTAGAA